MLPGAECWLEAAGYFPVPIFDLQLKAALEEHWGSLFTYQVCFSANRVIDSNDVGWCVMVRAAFPSPEQPSIHVIAKWAVIHMAEGCRMPKDNISSIMFRGRLFSAHSCTGERSLQLYCSSVPIKCKLNVSQTCFLLNKQLNSVLPRLENFKCAASLLESNFHLTFPPPALCSVGVIELSRWCQHSSRALYRSALQSTSLACQGLVVLLLFLPGQDSMSSSWFLSRGDEVLGSPLPASGVLLFLASVALQDVKPFSSVWQQWLLPGLERPGLCSLLTHQPQILSLGSTLKLKHEGTNAPCNTFSY